MKKTILHKLSLVGCWLLLVLSLGYGSSSYAANRALLIGIADYPIQPLNGPMADLENATRLAREIWGFDDSEIMTLRNEEATRDNILQALDQWLVQGSVPGDSVLFYYSGHGFYQRDLDGDESDGRDETIVPIDVRFEDGLFHGMILDDELDVVISQLTQRNALFIFDSCHSGTVTRSLSQEVDYEEQGFSVVKKLEPHKWRIKTRAVAPDSPEPDEYLVEPLPADRSGSTFTSDPNVEIWTAVTSYQLAFTDLVQGKGSVFTNALAKGLGDGQADLDHDGRISRTELLQFVRLQSQSFCSQVDKCKAGLTPTLEIRKDLLLADYATGRPQPGVTSAPPQASSQLMQTAFAPRNQADVKLRLFPEGAVRLGEALKISLTTGRAGHVVLLDLDSAGDLRQVYPNRYSGCMTSYVEAGQPLLIPSARSLPFQLVAQPPLGKGVLAAVVLHDNADIAALACEHADLGVIENVGDYVAGLAEQLTAVWIGEDFDRALEWSSALLEYEIVAP